MGFGIPDDWRDQEDMDIIEQQWAEVNDVGNPENEVNWDMIERVNHCDACGITLDGDETHYDGEQVLCRPCSDKIPCTVPGCAWHETPEQELARQTHENSFRDYLEISPLITKAGKREQYWELGGHDGPEPLECLERALQRALDEVRELRGHEHQWNEDDYCDICGRDGRV